MEDSSKNMMLSWEDFIYIVDLFVSDPRRHLALLGGEPTLHPRFVDFILYLNARNFHTTVFTSGIMAPKKLEETALSLDNIPEEKYTFVCNLNHPDMSSDAETRSIEAFFSEFGSKVTLSFNIFHLDFEMEYLFDYIGRFNLRRHVRLGLAAPIPGENNTYIEPNSFSAIAERLFSYFPMFIEHNVSIGFDCGFPLCIFTDEQLGMFLRHSKGGGAKMIKFGCSPALDIGPDMSVWSCFPLSRYHKRSLYEFNSITEVYDYYKDFHRNIRKINAGIYPECEECMYRENNQCAGGCLAHILNKQKVLADEKTVRKTEKTV